MPTKATLRSKGLTPESWQRMFDRQMGMCRICNKQFEPGKVVIDHEHVRGFKKMRPERKVQYVRGLLCRFCNHKRLSRYIKAEHACAMADYLMDYEKRKPE